MPYLLRDAYRYWRRRPATFGVLAATLALGIGITAGTFGFLDAAVSSAAPFRDPGSTVRLQFESGRARLPGVPREMLDEWSARSRTLRSFAGATIGQRWIRSPDVTPITVAETTGAFFALTDARPLRGHLPDASADCDTRSEGIALIGEAFWRRRFGGSPDAIGTTLSTDAGPVHVAGVLPGRFWYPSRDVQIWIQCGSAARAQRVDLAFAELVAGASPAQADSELDGIAAAASTAAGASAAGAIVRRVTDVDAADRAAVILQVLAAAAIVLLTCINVSAVMLSNAIASAREIAVRSALGAGRVRIALHVLVETAAVAAAGGALGLGLGAATARVLARFFPNAGADPGMFFRPSVLIYTFCATAVAAVLAGSYPAWYAARRSSTGGLLQTSSTAAESRLLRTLIVPLQIAGSVALLVVAGLVGRSMQHVRAVDPGFDTAPLWTAGADLPRDEATRPEEILHFYERLIDDVRRTGTVRAAPASQLPLSAGRRTTTVVAGRTSAEAQTVVVTPGYFAATGIQLLRGRDFSTDDRSGAPAVAIINGALARRLWRSVEPLGQYLQIEVAGSRVLAEVAGVVADIRTVHPVYAPAPQVYLPFAQHPQRAMQLVIRAEDGLPPSLEPVLRQATVGDRLTPPRRFDDTIERLLAAPTALGQVLALTALLALGLALLGTYGTLSEFVARREREIGIRRAMGATNSDIYRLVMLEILRLSGAGTLTGITVALVAGRLVRALLFGVSPADPAIHTVVALLVCITAAGAALLPARRATRVNPARLLRAE